MHDDTTSAPTSRQHLLVAAMFAVGSATMFWASTTGSPHLRVAPSIGFVMAFVFALGAVRVLAMRANRAQGDGRGFALTVCTCFAIIEWYLALKPTAACRAGTSAYTMHMASGATCRVAWSAGAIIVTIMTLVIAGDWLRSLRQNDRP